jgi:RNA polymerase sigma-70 factor, ECF subfamily
MAGRVDHILERGRDIFPTIRAPFASLRGRIERTCAAAPADPNFDGDLFLAAACAQGDPDAIAIFEQRYMSQLERHLGRMDLTPAEVDEVRQRLRISLLAGTTPGIATFSGRAPLDAWVRVAAIRAAVRYVTRERNGAAADSALSAIFARQAESDFLVDADLRPRLRAALEQALRQLSARDRAILRLHFLDGLNIDAVGLVFGVHRATVARWLVRIRAGVFRAVRDQLALELRPSSSEMRSLMRLIRDDLQVSLGRVLGESG